MAKWSLRRPARADLDQAVAHVVQQVQITVADRRPIARSWAVPGALRPIESVLLPLVGDGRCGPAGRPTSRTAGRRGWRSSTIERMVRALTRWHLAGFNPAGRRE